jgi:hypothetical protein
MNDIGLSRELKGYEGDKKMTKMAISVTQNQMKEQLLGDMGKDIKDVLDGKRFVTVSKYKRKKFQILSWFRRLLRKF